MRKRLPLVAILIIACLAGGLYGGAQLGSAKPTLRAPKGFFGIDPQAALTDEDAAFMKAGGIETVRWPMIWAAIQPTKNGPYDWSSLDPIVAVAARHGLKVLPFVVATPRWVAAKSTTLPVNNARARAAWTRSPAPSS